jgi:ribose transport system permease protein
MEFRWSRRVSVEPEMETNKPTWAAPSGLNKKIVLLLLNNAPLLLFALVFLVFGLMSGRFIEVKNLSNILVQSSATGVVAIGMTLVLLTAGVDLSVGTIMFIGVAVAGKLIFNGQPLWIGFLAALAVGLVFGAINAFFITRLRIMAFIVTLATLFAGRGFGLWLTNTRAMNMPGEVTQLGAAKILGLPVPVLVFALVCLAAHLILTRTAFGRQVYAVGSDIEAARKAGLNVSRILFAVYVLSGVCAALSGLVSLTQTGAVSPSFGQQKEFTAIAAAVLGGTSLFGGRGRVFPGTVLGAVLIQTVENGLVIINADAYLYPLITSAIIFLAVLLDSTRTRLLTSLNRRHIRVERTV